MGTLMRNSVRLIHREALRCMVSRLDSFPSLLQQSLFSASYAALDEYRHAATSGYRALVVSSSPSVEYPVRYNASQIPSFGTQGLFVIASSLAVSGIPSRTRFCFSDTSISSTNSSWKIKIHTKTGGESSLHDEQRQRKDDSTFEALGDVEELNSALGLAHEYCSQAQLTSTLQQIEEIQSRLLDIESGFAPPLRSLSSKKALRVKFNAPTVAVLESWIDKMDEELPDLKVYILPSGGLPAASLHLARAICRRAERKVVTLVEEQVVDQSISRYFNRLSDYLFTAARYTALKLGKPEAEWRINRR